MPKFLVSAHQTQWGFNQDRGRIRLKLDGVKKIQTLKPSSATEFFAVLMMLQGHKQVIYDSDKKVLSTSW